MKKVVVLWDFTEIAEYALAHAEIVAVAKNLEIELLHVVTNGVILNDPYNRMKSFVESRGCLVHVTPVVVVGDIFTTISEYVNRGMTEIVVLGTHGRKGIQKLTGSWALKVIVGSDVPFLVVSRPPKSDSYSRIVFPIDFKKENKEMLSWILYVAKSFDSMVYLFQQEARDSFTLSKINNNLNFARKILCKNDIRFDVKICSGSHFEDKVEVFSREIEADLIVITTTKNINGFDYMFGAFEQKLISNEEGISVMCVNPRKALGFNYNSLY